MLIQLVLMPLVEMLYFRRLRRSAKGPPVLPQM
jgi:hypothetical protein